MAVYCLEQISIWAALRAVFLFWAVKFPFSYRNLLSSGRIRYAHIISVLLAVIIPLPSALVFLKDGFLNNRNPGIVCIGRNIDHIYYLLILPISIFDAVTSCLLLLIFWIVLKVDLVRNSSESRQCPKCITNRQNDLT